MKYFLLALMLFSSMTLADSGSMRSYTVRDTNEAVNIGVSAVISLTTYYLLRKISDNKLGCAIGAMVMTELVMLINIHTADTDDALKMKMKDHTIGAAFVIPVAIFE